MSRARIRYAEAAVAALLLLAVISAPACSEDGVTPKCGADQPLYNIHELYEDGGLDRQDIVNGRANAADAGCMTPVGSATSSGGSTQGGGAGTLGAGAGGVAGNTNTGGIAGTAGNGGAQTGGAANGGSAGANAGAGGLGIGGFGGIGLGGVAGAQL